MPDFSLTPLSYSKDLITQYQKLKHLSGFVLLESGDQSIGRYDIVTACPYEHLVFSPVTQSMECFIEQLRQRLPNYHLPLDLPFQGGGIGFFSYDFAALMHNIPIQKEEIPRAYAEIALYDWAIITDHLKKEVTLLAVNYHKATAEIVREVLECWHNKTCPSYTFSLEQTFSPLIEKEEYQHAFYTIKEDLQQGRCYQVNYTQPFRANYNGDSWAVFTKIRAKNRVPYAAYLQSEQGDILSFSPERFIKKQHTTLLTSPIKGTAKRSSNAQQDELLRQQLGQSEKNRAENIMIVDLLRNDLSKIAQIGSVRVRELCTVESYQFVHHLVSHITAQALDPMHLLDMFLSCFPGASITGAPKLEAMKIISELESYPRGIYCGSIGYFSAHGNFDSNIAIRTLVAQRNNLLLSAGGGIVIDSHCEEEYQECLIKIKAICQGLN